MHAGPTPSDRPHPVTFVLLPGFALLPFAGALDTLRAANEVAGSTLYRCRAVAPGGGMVAPAAGPALQSDGPLPDTVGDETLLLCGGPDIAGAADRVTLAWLRRAARSAHAVGGIGTAAHVMARAGLLDGRRAAIHRDHRDSFAETFHDVDVTRALYAIDGSRYTAAGGAASIDLILRLVARDAGEPVAAAVADRVGHPASHGERETRGPAGPPRGGVHHPKLAEVIGQMETHIEDPVSPAILAREVGLSTRQLERLFRQHLNRSPKRYYMELRLQKAHNLLLQSNLSVINVALACGFSSPSHFSKCYRGKYGTTPYRERGMHGQRAARLDAFRLPTDRPSPKAADVAD